MSGRGGVCLLRKTKAKGTQETDQALLICMHSDAPFHAPVASGILERIKTVCWAVEMGHPAFRARLFPGGFVEAFVSLYPVHVLVKC